MKKNKSTGMTLSTAFDEVWTVAQEEGMTPSFCTKAKKPLKFIEDKLGLTAFQSYIVCIIMENDGAMSTKEIAHACKMGHITMVTHMSEVTDLCNKKFLAKKIKYERGSNRKTCYAVHDAFMTAMCNGEEYHAIPDAELSNVQMLKELNGMICSLDEYNSQNDIKEMRELLFNTKHLHFSKTVDELKLNDGDFLLLCIATTHLVLANDSVLSEEDYMDELEAIDERDSVVKSMNAGCNDLITLNFLEVQCMNGIARPGRYKFTDMAYSDLLLEFGLQHTTNEEAAKKVQGMKNPEDIQEKSLYYNETEHRQVERLAKLLQKDTFFGVQQRMKDANMRHGFTCLFYGAPGTGKTETVMQLARMTGRYVYHVDVAQLRDKYVGESEKKVAALFNRYRHMCKDMEVTPILLFNEADAIINTRNESASKSVDKMENAIQNIILQEMETLPGIMIATTNLTQNMDKAFERRFLYKIEFQRPSADVRARIWRTMMPGLDESVSTHLASKYDFSGGQIENVARKSSVDTILYDLHPSKESLISLCEEECIVSKNSRARIGF